MTAIAAASEALAPLKELHKPRDMQGYCETVYQRCAECDWPWPCDTAKLIYREDEL